LEEPAGVGALLGRDLGGGGGGGTTTPPLRPPAGGPGGADDSGAGECAITCTGGDDPGDDGLGGDAGDDAGWGADP
jgi:hypothetical protein